MFWIALALLALIAGYLVRQRRLHPPENEPWRASLPSDEPLDMDEIRRAEAEWEADEGWSDSDDDLDESWR